MKAYLKIISGQFIGTIFPLREGENLVGRRDLNTQLSPEIDLEEYDVDARISRRHAMIQFVNGRVRIRDLGSLNGTFLGADNRLDQTQIYELKDKSEILVGKILMRIHLEL